MNTEQAMRMVLEMAKKHKPQEAGKLKSEWDLEAEAIKEVEDYLNASSLMED